MAAITERLQEIARKYGEVRVDERELSRKAKKEELVTKLKQLYGDEVVSTKGHSGALFLSRRWSSNRH